MPRDLGPSPAAVPPATRASRPGWRDPRMWIGIAIVAASVLVGSRVLASADDTVQVWAVADDAEPGVELTRDDLVARRMRFAESSDLEHYLRVDGSLPDDMTVLRAIGAGELLPRSAVGVPDDDGTVTLSLGVTPLLVPSAIGPGSVVDVYVTGQATAGTTRPEGGTTPPPPGSPVLDDVRVVAAAPPGDVGATGERQVELAVPGDAVEAYYALLATLTAPVVSLTQES